MSETLPQQSGDDSVESLKAAAEGTMFEVSGTYGEFVETSPKFVEQFSDDERKQLQYESHGTVIDPSITVYNQAGIIISVVPRMPRDFSVALEQKLQAFQGMQISKELLQRINTVALDAIQQYFSPEKQRERSEQAQERVRKANLLLMSAHPVLNNIYSHPQYSTSEQLREIALQLEKEIHKLKQTLNTLTPSVSEEYLLELAYTLQGLEYQTYLHRYAQSRAAADRLPVENLEYVRHMHPHMEGVDTLISKRVAVAYSFSEHSKQYEMYGYVPYVKNVVREVNDISLSADARLRESALVKDTLKAVDLRLGALGARLYHKGEREKLLAAGRRDLKKEYVQDAKEFAELLVGAGEVSHPDLYNPELAMRWGREVVENMSLNEAIAWAKDMDAKVGYWQSPAQGNAAQALFTGIRFGLKRLLNAQKANIRTQQDMEYYGKKSLEVSRLFRLERTIKEYAPHTLAPHEYYDRLRNTGIDQDFAVEMTKEACGFEDLAFHYMALEKKEKDPLSSIVDSQMPQIERDISERLGPEGMAKLEAIPQYNEMIDTAHTTPSTVTDCVKRYAVFMQLKSLADGTEVSESALQKDIEEKFKPYIATAADALSSYLGERYMDLAQRRLTRIGTIPLSETQRKALIQLADMEGLAWFDFSDETWARVYLVGKIAGMIAVGIAAGIATGGMSLIAQMAVVGLTMTATGVVMEGRAVDTFGEGVESYGTDFAINAAGVGFGRVLAGARYAAQLRNVNPAGMGARQIFAEAMESGGMAQLGQYYDDALSLGTRLAGATAESAVDVTATSWVDTQLIPGTTFIENLQRNAWFLGIPFGMEFRRDVLKGLRMASDAQLRASASIENEISVHIERMQLLCGDAIDVKKFYESVDPKTFLQQSGIFDSVKIEEILAERKAMRDLEGRRYALLQDISKNEHSKKVSKGSGSVSEGMHLERTVALNLENTLKDIQDIAAGKMVEGAKILNDGTIMFSRNFVAIGTPRRPDVAAKTVEFTIQTKFSPSKDSMSILITDTEGKGCKFELGLDTKTGNLGAANVKSGELRGQGFYKQFMLEMQNSSEAVKSIRSTVGNQETNDRFARYANVTQKLQAAGVELHPGTRPHSVVATTLLGKTRSPVFAQEAPGKNLRAVRVRKDVQHLLSEAVSLQGAMNRVEIKLLNPAFEIKEELRLNTEEARDLVQRLRNKAATLDVHHQQFEIQVLENQARYIEAMASTAERLNIAAKPKSLEAHSLPKNVKNTEVLLPHEMTREQFGELIVFHGTSGKNAHKIRESIMHPKIQENPKYKGYNYEGRIISNGTIGMGADFTYNAITAAAYAKAKAKIHDGKEEGAVVFFTRRSDIDLPAKGTYQDAAEASLTEGNPDTKAKTGGVLGSIPAALFDGLDQLSLHDVEIAMDRAYAYVRSHYSHSPQ